MSSLEPATRPWWRTPRTWVAFALGLGVSQLISLTPDSW